MTGPEHDDVPPDEVLPCGCVLRCRVVEGRSELVYIPCSTSCVNYQNALGLAAETGTPVERRAGS
jgi:hypothetical protein